MTTLLDSANGDLQNCCIAASDGNNLIIGGAGNDLVMTGAGNNTLVLGNGNNIVSGGVEVSSASPYWSATTNNAYPYHTLYSGISDTSAPFNAPTPYYGNYIASNPVGLGNDTIFGGSGDNLINLESIKRCKREAANDMKWRVVA